MAPAGDVPTPSAPGAAAVQGKKPSDARPDPVTPKTLFNNTAGSKMVNKLVERTSALKLDDLPAPGKGDNAVKPSAAGSSSSAPDVLDKGKTKAEDKDNEDGYLSDDPDECQDPEVLNAIAAQAGFAITLLVPFAWNKEVPRTINTVRHLLLVWGKHLSENVRTTTGFKQLSATYLSKKHFGRLQVVFQQEADAKFVWSREVEHYTMNDKKITLGWQYPENAGYLKERALHPEAIEVLLKGVPAVISPEMIRKNLVTAMLLKRGRTSFLDGSSFHRVLDPVSGSDTDKIKGLVYRHPGHKCSQQRALELTSVSSPPQAAASLKLSAASKIIMADPAVSLTSVGGVREEWICVQEECGKAHGNNLEQAVDHVQSQLHCSGLLKAGAATRQSRGKQNLADVRKEYGK
ncbi:unnamed protein product [Closterium sp. Naga37s-1]|nr:unnamed protein product [Closterium sp. Naga37s-1]